MHLIVNGRGIVEIKKKSFVKRIFCKHSNVAIGLNCSSTGMTRISGEDWYAVCECCGKVFDEQHTNY